MAQLTATTIDGNLTLDTLKKIDGTVIVETNTLSLKGYMNRRVLTQVNTTTYTTSATRRAFTLIHTFPVLSGFKSGSLIELSYHIPTRNDNESWGGIFIEPQVNINGSGWFSLGGTGYDLMYSGARCIGSYYNNILFDPAQSIDFTLQFRFYMASYDGSTTINGSHSIGTRSGTANGGDMSGDNSNQHYWTLKIEELAKTGGNV